MKKCCFNCKECYCIEPKNFIHVCNKMKHGVNPNTDACPDYEVKESCKDDVKDD